MRYIVIGAGAVGGSIGASLFAAGSEVVLVARGEHRDRIAEAGLEFATPRGTENLRVPVVAGPDELDLEPDDVLIVAVKVQDSLATLDEWSGRPVTGGGTAGTELPVVCAQNGVEGERIALRRFARVYGMCVVLPAGYLTPGRITAIGDPEVGALTIGRYPTGSDGLVHRISADLRQANIAGYPSTTVMRWKYAKLLANLGNAVEAICGPVEGEAAVALLRRARSEGEHALKVAGIDYADPAENGGVHLRLRTGEIAGQPRAGGSTWQSLTRGAGSVEADYLAGEIVLIGRLGGIPTPVNETLNRIADEMSRRGLAPGSRTAEELLVLVDEAAVRAEARTDEVTLLPAQQASSVSR